MVSGPKKRLNIYVSPNAGDVVFYELRSPLNAPNRGWEFGDAHPNTAEFPGYKLAAVKPENEQGFEQWFYAKDRDAQEAHNWKVSYPYAGIVTCPRFSCIFILPRATYSAIAKGTAHPLDLGVDTPAANEKFKGAKLVLERQVDTGFAEIESLYIAVERIYDRIPDEAEQLTVNISTSYPHGGLKEYPRRTRDLIYARQLFAPVTKGTADPIFTNAFLIDETQLEIDDEALKSLYVAVRRTYDVPPTVAAQEAYNAEITYPYFADTRFPRTTRTYQIPRSTLGSAVIPSVGLALGGATLAFRKVDRIAGQPEDSYYVVVTVAHDRIPLASDVTPGGEYDFLKGFGYQISRPYGTDDHPRVTWRIPAVKTGFSLTAEYTACPITGYTGLLLTDETAEADPNNASQVSLVRVYDSLPGPELEAEIREKFADVPEGFIVERKIETVRQPVKNDATIAALDGAAPNDVGGAVIKTQLGVDGQSSVVLGKGNTRVTFTLGSLTSVEYDEETGRVSDVTEEIVDAGTAGAALNSGTGLFSTIRALNQYFSIKRTQKATTLGTGLQSISYDTIINWGWPPVLQGVNFFAVEYKDRDTGVEYLGRYGWDVLMKEAYAGPCRATVVESWSATAQAVPTVVHLMPTAIEFDFPMTRNFSIPRCLHPSVSLTEVVGTDHPDLVFATTTKSFAATNYTDWPASIIASAQQVPYRGGFRMKVVTVYKPA